MRENMIVMGFIVLGVIWVILMAAGLDEQHSRMDKYNDTISEYMMCIKYNNDCDCSDIILGEYAEVE